MTGGDEGRLRFNRSDTHVVDELRLAEVLLRDESTRILPDAKMAGLLADVFHRWARMGRFDADFLNRAGGSETVLLARHILQCRDQVINGRIVIDGVECPVCEVCEDYDGERIRRHCNEHCPRVRSGDWDRCKGC